MEDHDTYLPLRQIEPPEPEPEDAWAWIDGIRRRAVEFVVGLAIAGVLYLAARAILRAVEVL